MLTTITFMLNTTTSMLNSTVCSLNTNQPRVFPFPSFIQIEKVQVEPKRRATRWTIMSGKQSPVRMVVMLPLLFLMNKVDFENEETLFLARVAFAVAQLVALGAAVYVKNVVQVKNDTRKIFVPGQKSPFDQSPNFDDLTETTYVAYESQKAGEFLKQTMIGGAIAAFVHFKMGVNQVMVIQAVMAPFNLYDNPLVRAYVLRRSEGRLWNERLEGESNEEAAAASGIPATATAAAATTKTSVKKTKSIGQTPEEAIAKVLAAGVDADFDELWDAVKGAVNAKTKEDQWTALMVACGSPIDTDEFIRKVIAAGADVTAVDGDGWTALHWSAFHGRPEAAETLLASCSSDKLDVLLAATASDGRTALEVAKGEENDDVVAVIKSFREGAPASSANDGDSNELRQRKPIEDVD